MAKWTKEEEDILEANLFSMSYREIGKLLGRSKNCVAQHAAFMGLKNVFVPRKYSVDHNFFDDTTPEACYYAGLIASDGTIKKNTVSITQKTKNSKPLFDLKDCSKYTGPIYGPTKTAGEDVFQLCVSSKQWVCCLEKYYNIKPNKSLILPPPNIERDDLVLAFIVGLIDGDGSMGTYVRKKGTVVKISLCGTKDMLYWVNDFFEKRLPQARTRKNSQPRKIKRCKATYELSISGYRAIKLWELARKIPQRMLSKWDLLNYESLEKKEYIHERNKLGQFCS